MSSTVCNHVLCHISILEQPAKVLTYKVLTYNPFVLKDAHKVRLCPAEVY